MSIVVEPNELLAIYRSLFYIPSLIGASVGITMYPEDASDYEDLLVNADLAMYAAKNKGRNTCMFYTPELASAALSPV